MKVNFLKLSLILLTFCSCQKNEEVFDLTESSVKIESKNQNVEEEKDADDSNTSFRTSNLFFSSSDNIRGWSWSGFRASYIAFDGDNSILYIRDFFNGRFGDAKKLFFSSSNNIRGWSWHNDTASYIVYENGKSVLYIRSFDGSTFGPPRKLFLTSSDNIYGWSWDGYTASYIAGGDTLITRSFDGNNFGDSSIKMINRTSDYRSFSNFEETSYHMVATDLPQTSFTTILYLGDL